jgi:hypothetical protein
MRTFDWLRLLVVIAGLTGCSRARVQTVESFPGPPMSRPDHIFVAYFAVTPEQVRLDRGVSARIVGGAGDEPLDAEALGAVRALQAGLAERLVGRLKTYGLVAEIATNNMGGGNGLLVQGQIVSIDPGKKSRRVLISLDGGGSGIDADTQLYALTEAAPPRLLTAFEGQADVSEAPDADQMADAIAPRIGAFAVAQGWIRQTALK